MTAANTAKEFSRVPDFHLFPEESHELRIPPYRFSAAIFSQCSHPFAEADQADRPKYRAFWLQQPGIDRRRRSHHRRSRSAGGRQATQSEDRALRAALASERG